MLDNRSSDVMDILTLYHPQGIVTLFLICHVWKVIPTTYEAVQSWRDWLEDEVTQNGKQKNGANPGMTTDSLFDSRSFAYFKFFGLIMN